MSIQSLFRLTSAIKGINESVDNLAKIREARAKQEKEDEIFKLNKQVKEAQLKKLKISGENTQSETDVLELLMKDDNKKQTDIFKGKVAIINQAEQQEKDKAKQLEKIGSLAFEQTRQDALQQQRDTSAFLSNVNPNLPQQSQQQDTQSNLERAIGKLPPGVSVNVGNLRLTGQKPDKPTEAENFRADIQSFRKGDLSQGDLQAKFPEKDLRPILKRLNIAKQTPSARKVQPIAKDVIAVTDQNSDLQPSKFDEFGDPTGFTSLSLDEKQKELVERVKISSKIGLGKLVSKNNIANLAGVMNDFSQVLVDAIEEGGAGGIIQQKIGETATKVGDLPGFLGGGEIGSKFPATGALPGKRQELILKMMPMLTQQAIKPEGSIRLIQGVLDAIGQTIPDAGTGKKAAKRQLQETIRTFYRFAKSSELLGREFDKEFGGRSPDIEGQGDNVAVEITDAEIRAWVNSVNSLSGTVNIEGEELKAMNNLIDTTLEPLERIIDKDTKAEQGKELQTQIDDIDRQLKELGG